jgi:hypothetical protein
MLRISFRVRRVPEGRTFHRGLPIIRVLLAEDHDSSHICERGFFRSCIMLLLEGERCTRTNRTDGISYEIAPCLD